MQVKINGRPGDLILDQCPDGKEVEVSICHNDLQNSITLNADEFTKAVKFLAEVNRKDDF